mgnify:CR=1 FL=1
MTAYTPTLHRGKVQNVAFHQSTLALFLCNDVSIKFNNTDEISLACH